MKCFSQIFLTILLAGIFFFQGYTQVAVNTDDSPAESSAMLDVKSVTPRGTKQSGLIDRSKVDPQIVRAAEGMEAMFLDYMMNVMRQTVPKNELDLESPATGIYRQMLDSEYAQKAVRTGGVGLAEQIIAYLDSRRYTLPQGHGAPSAHTGGTHEDQSIDQ